MDSITIEIPTAVLREQMLAALVRADGFGRGDAPLASVCARVVKAHLPAIEERLREVITLVLTDETFAAELQQVVRVTLRNAIEAKARSVVASLQQTTVLSLVRSKEDK